MKYKQIVFDIDGTLLNSEDAILHALQDTLLRVTGKKVPLEELTFCFGITGEDTLRQLQIEDIPSTMQLWFDILQQYEHTLSIYEGIEELLETLSKAGCGLGIITSKPRVLFLHDFCQFSVSSYFHTVVCADDTQRHKPTAEPLLKYMDLSKTNKTEILYIGDSIYDSQCAQNAGVDFALAVWGSHTDKTPANYYPKKPLDLLSILADKSF
ncbi:MAG: HAD family hydrolase [Clostridium sp.]|nr:HAD family hydrolase [Clostridium sp.]